jgi:ribose-phosphate pyrophosphokinase
MADNEAPDLPNNFFLLTGTSNPKLAEEIGKILGKEVYKPVTKFADGESRVQIPVNIRRGSIVIIQSTCPPDVDGSIVELLLMIDAAKRASADEIITVIPYFGYARQDRKDRPRVPISASIIAGVVEFAGASKICTIDIHSDPQQGFIKSPWDNLYGSYSLVPKIEELNLKDLVVASPDKGGVPMATAYAKRLNSKGLAIVFKERDVNMADQSQVMDLIGDVKGKPVLMVDDMISTAGTICNAATLIKEKGATQIFVAATHGVFSGNALENINNSPIDKIFITNTIPQPEVVTANPKIEVVSVSAMLAEAIKRIETGQSISETLILSSDSQDEKLG